MDALARAYVAEHHPAARFAVLGGSAASGPTGPRSDLDVLVLVDDTSADGVATVTFEGRLVEAFVYHRQALDHWLVKEVESRRPVLLEFLAHGTVLVDDGSGAELRSSATRVLDDGPRPLDAKELDLRRYRLSALLDDLRDVAPGGHEEYAVLADAFESAAELLLLTNGGWLGTGKWLTRRMAGLEHPLADALLAWAAGAREPGALLELGTAVLDSCGGYLQSGFVRGTVG